MASVAFMLVTFVSERTKEWWFSFSVGLYYLSCVLVPCLVFSYYFKILKVFHKLIIDKF